MSDFLDRLAARSAVGKPNLRPRLMPRFDASPLTPEESFERPTPTVRAAVPPEEIVRKVRQTPAEAVEPRSVTEVHEQHFTTVEKVSERLTEIDRETVTERRVDHEILEARAEREPAAAFERPVAPVAPRLREVPETPVSAVTQVVRMLPEKPAPTPAAVAKMVPGVAAPLPVEYRSEAAPRTPDVEIHIGRVEVRAQFAPAPAKRETTKPKAPSLSLDQYLEGRR